MLSAALLSSAGGGNDRALWYLSRGTGVVSLVLLSIVMVLGLLQVGRVAKPGLARLVLVSLHRNAALVGVGLLAVHIATAIADPYVTLRIVDAFVPFTASYRPLWVGLGALTLDAMLVVVATSLVRDRIGRRWWRAVHWAAYGMWPLAVLHGWKTGTDTRLTWVAAIYVACIAAVLVAVALRFASRSRGEATPSVRTEAWLSSVGSGR